MKAHLIAYIALTIVVSLSLFAHHSQSAYTDASGAISIISLSM